MSTVRQQIVDAVKTRFEGILTANGYLTDLGQRVFLCRPSAPRENELPALNIWDLAEDCAPSLSKVHAHTLELDVFIMCGGSKGSTLSEYVRQAISDIYKAIGVDTRWGALAINTHPGRNQYEIDGETKQLINTVRVSFKITYRTINWDALTPA